MFTMPLDTTKMGSFIVETVEPSVSFDTKVQKTHPETGFPQFIFNCRYVSGEEGARPEGIRVKIYCKSEPKVDPYTPVVFDGLKAIYWENAGKSGVSFSAEKVGRRS